MKTINKMGKEIIKSDENASPYYKRTWDEFRKNGLLLFVNQFLQIFGWSIIFELDSLSKVVDVYPVRTKFRGFDNELVSENYIKLSEFLKNNADDLYEEACE